ncbi:TonB-dependent receptor domain-containing protein [Sphingomonas hylomeconis]|uniref:TonB-dependent receptor domain-containing protein n=1 Tax=Sphingomonas hylomeconis TaxID=1395958 RepID=A0ABV7SXY9_9SPHN|nr:TonB-dependent receptor [Sphingomonas hylomeconis]
MKLSRFFAAAALVPLAIASMTPAFAQVSSPTVPDDTATEETSQEITVTGSRIRAPNLESAVPVTVVAGEQFFQTGRVSIGDVLNDLPQLRNTFSQQNSTRFLGTRGLNLLDLRGLGTQRTLVLVNGRRHVAADILSNGVSPDTNTFPTDLIERVEIVTGGNSAVYGSDAIAGVVNFILKDSFDGLQIRGQSGISQYGDAGNQYVSALGGKNFADGRGNIALNLEYAHQSRYFGSGRPNLRQADGFLVVDTDPAGTTNGSDGVFDRKFFRDIRSTTISPGGQVGIRYANNASAPCGRDAVGSAFTCAYLFQPDGSLVQQTGTRVGLGPNGSFIGGNGQTGREGQLLTLSPQLDRYSANAIGHFEVSPAFVPFFEAKYVRTEAFGSVSGPLFSQGQTLADNFTVDGFRDASYFNTGGAAGNVNREGIRLDNPFLNAQARATLQQQLLAAVNSSANGLNPNTGAAFTDTPASQAERARIIAQINDGSFRFSNRRNYVDLGIRDERIRRETYRGVVGIRGTFNDDWNYEASANYGVYKERNVIQGNINTQRFLLANDTARNAAGQIVCRSQIDPRYAGEDVGGNPAQLAADIAACVPLNPFGTGSVTKAVRDYLTVQSEATGKITQFVGSAFVSGDLSQLFELPGGPVAFSVGGEYRRETNSYDLDDLTQAGYAFYNAIPSFRAPAFAVKEAYGELRVPLVKDVFLLQELTFGASGRVADYKGATGTVYAYGFTGEWRPVDQLRFRAAYNRSVRAPNLSELYSEQGQNFTPAPNDPCSERNIGTGSATRAANCAAAGRPAGYDYVYTASLETVSGGNPNLRAETSDSYTYGGVWEPSFVPGLSISVDYYNIKVKDVITATGTPQQILNLCYDSPTLNNAFCSLFERAGAAGGPRGEQQFRVLEGSLLQSSANFAALQVRGIDTNIAYRHRFNFGTVNLGAVWTHTLQNDEFTNPADPNFANVLTNELGDPQDQVNVNASVKIGAFTLGGQARWIGKMYLNTYEDYNSLNGLPPQNTDYAEVKKYGVAFYQDLRADVDVNDKFNFYLGVDNVTNKQPPFGLTGVTEGGGIYDVRGRYAYAGFVAKF